MVGAGRELPSTYEEAAQLLRSAADDGRRVRLVGGATKLSWGAPVDDVSLEVSSTLLNRILEHNHADLTAIVQAGVRFADAQAAFAERGQMLAVDPPMGDDDGATLGGVVATGDSGPLRHRYGATRDLLVGMKAALPNGTVAGAGGKVIKNVAGYDLTKLFCGAFGTLGMVCQVAVRLHPIPQERVSAIGSSEDPDAVQRATLAIARAPLEVEALDVFWQRAAGTLAARLSGSAAGAQVSDAVKLMEEAGIDARKEEDDGSFWEGQRSRQRARSGAVVKVSALMKDLGGVLRAADRAGASVTGRAARGVSYIYFDHTDAGELVQAIEALRAEVRPADAVVLDAPEEVRRKVEVWGDEGDLPVELMRRVKARFDPAGVCNPGIFVGGI